MSSVKQTETRQTELDQCFGNMNVNLEHLFQNVPNETQRITAMQNTLKLIKTHVKDLLLQSNGLAYIKAEDLTATLTSLGSGHFGQVWETKYKGSKVAVKILKDEANSQFEEANLLRCLSHENIVAYRGTGYVTAELACKLNISEKSVGEEQRFLVMEFIPQTLAGYMRTVSSHESPGLSSSRTWSIGQQVSGALSYLHSISIVHRDLKPDNILIDPKRFVVKVADFGLAWYNKLINEPTIRSSSVSAFSPKLASLTDSSGSEMQIHARWGPPEFFPEDDEDSSSEFESSDSSKSTKSMGYTIEDFMKGDIYCFGLLLSYSLTGTVPYVSISSSTVAQRTKTTVDHYPIEVPSKLSGPLRMAIDICLEEEPLKRPSADQTVKDYFSEDANPYYIFSKSVEFFSCGFMDKTDIFVADSCTSEKATQKGFYKSGERPHGYDHKNLICPVETQNAPYYNKETDWSLESKYIEKNQTFLEKSYNKEIDNNPTIALKELTLARPGEEEKQFIQLKFQQSDYCHHRAMRDIWMNELNSQDKNTRIICKTEVDKYFSTSFGLHVAVLTNEGEGNPQKFIFAQRAKKPGMSSPGLITCGAVESASVHDYIQTDKKNCVNLVATAARGLCEELGLDLTGTDIDTITLTTIYLKFDTHEWGMCGYVDLCDKRIAKENRISAENLQSRFTSGPKDKFEHQSLNAVPFNLESMTDYVLANHDSFASSAKLVVVKVMQAFFGWEKVQKEFEMRS